MPIVDYLVQNGSSPGSPDGFSGMPDPIVFLNHNDCSRTVLSRACGMITSYSVDFLTSKFCWGTHGMLAHCVCIFSFDINGGNRRSPASDQPVASQHSARTRVVLLGTGTPVPDPDRSGPATAIVVDDRAYLIDFGPGVVRRAESAALNRKIPTVVRKNSIQQFSTQCNIALQRVGILRNHWRNSNSPETRRELERKPSLR
jgi:hypothetical protein